MNQNKNIGIVGYDKSGPMFDAEEVNNNASRLIVNGNRMESAEKKSAAPLKEAGEIVDHAMQVFRQKLDNLVGLEDEFCKKAKASTGNMRSTIERMSDAVAKLEKTANFDRLERYVSLLERANAAMLSLTELQKNGALEKISNALK